MYSIIIIPDEDRLIIKKRKLVGRKVETISSSKMIYSENKDKSLEELIAIFEKDLMYSLNED